MALFDKPLDLLGKHNMGLFEKLWALFDKSMALFDKPLISL